MARTISITLHFSNWPKTWFSTARAAITRLALAFWWLRQITGDAAYENYLAHTRVTTQPEHPAPRMSRQEFYADSLRRRYSTINRCC